MNVEQTVPATSHITVCICTYKRPLLLKRLLNDIGRQNTGGLFTISIVVVDNDQTETAKPVVQEFTAVSPVPVSYFVEPQQNIALARNRAVLNATGEFIACIDDDEFPVEGWLRNLFNTCKTYKVSGVLGPVKPHFDHDAPQWVRRGGFFDRPSYNTGYRIGMWEARTGNVLFARSIIEGIAEPFRPEFGAGGEDIDFFRRMMEKGDVFIWCDEAAVYEVVPPERCTRRYHLQKALWRGSNFLKHPTDRTKNLLKSFVAVPLYMLALPVMLVAGHHHFMNYLVRLCDHSSRLLQLFGIQLVQERDNRNVQKLQTNR